MFVPKRPLRLNMITDGRKMTLIVLFQLTTAPERHEENSAAVTTGQVDADDDSDVSDDSDDGVDAILDRVKNLGMPTKT